MEPDDAIRSLQLLPKESTVRHRPPAGTTYVFQWEDDKNKGKLHVLNVLCYFRFVDWDWKTVELPIINIITTITIITIKIVQ